MKPGKRSVREGLRRGLKDEGGTALLETMVSLLTVVTLAFGLFELCLLTYTAVVLNYAAEQGVRYAILHGTDSSNCSGPDSSCTDKSYANVKSAVTSAASASMHDLSAMTINVTYGSGTAKPGNPVKVTLSYNYVPIVSIFSLTNAMTFSSEGEILF
ncbi:MAG: TadE/TadG family type IV pilus assembly protein [Gemmataceae bacterium]